MYKITKLQASFDINFWRIILSRISMENILLFWYFFSCKIQYFGPKIVKNYQFTWFCSQRSIFKSKLSPKKERSIRKYGKSPNEVSFFKRSITGHPALCYLRASRATVARGWRWTRWRCRASAASAGVWCRTSWWRSTPAPAGLTTPTRGGSRLPWRGGGQNIPRLISGPRHPGNRKLEMVTMSRSKELFKTIGAV